MANYWIARSIVDTENMNQLFVAHGIWYGNAPFVEGKLKEEIKEQDFIALVRTPNMIHAIGKIYYIATAHELTGGGKNPNDLHIFFVKPMDGDGKQVGWTKVEKKAPYTVRPTVQRVNDKVVIKAIWGHEE
jgi:hypothetical protein